jgi:hypothetical protein
VLVVLASACRGPANRLVVSAGACALDQLKTDSLTQPVQRAASQPRRTQWPSQSRSDTIAKGAGTEFYFQLNSPTPKKNRNTG